MALATIAPHCGFKAYVRAARVTGNPRGDFIKDARSDAGTPVIRSWDHLEGYLINCGACYEAIEAGRTVWRDFEKWRRRRGVAEVDRDLADLL